MSHMPIIGKSGSDHWTKKPTFRNWLDKQRTDTGHLGVLARRAAQWADWASPDDLRAELIAKGVPRGYFETMDVAEERWRHRLKYCTVTVELDDSDLAALLELAEVYGSHPKALRFAIRALHGRTPAAQPNKQDKS